MPARFKSASARKHPTLASSVSLLSASSSPQLCGCQILDARTLVHVGFLTGSLHQRCPCGQLRGLSVVTGAREL